MSRIIFKFFACENLIAVSPRLRDEKSKDINGMSHIFSFLFLF